MRWWSFQDRISNFAREVIAQASSRPKSKKLLNLLECWLEEVSLYKHVWTPTRKIIKVLHWFYFILHPYCFCVRNIIWTHIHQTKIRDPHFCWQRLKTNNLTLFRLKCNRGYEKAKNDLLHIGLKNNWQLLTSKVVFGIIRNHHFCWVRIIELLKRQRTIDFMWR